MKSFIFLFVLTSFWTTSNGQICYRAEGVQASARTYYDHNSNVYQSFEFYNSNPYKVTVDVKVTLAMTNGSENVFEQTFVIQPNSKKLDCGNRCYDIAEIKTDVLTKNIYPSKSKAEVVDCTKMFY